VTLTRARSAALANVRSTAAARRSTGWARGIKKLGGHFTTNDYNAGVWFDHNNGISEWELDAVNGKQTTTACVT